MAQVFKTRKDDPDNREILGVGVLGPNGLGGIPVEEAAKSITELQQKDPRGGLLVDASGQGFALEGAALNRAAKEFAALHGLEIKDVPEEKLSKLNTELGYPEDPLLPAGEQAVFEYNRMFGSKPLVEAQTDRVTVPVEDDKDKGGSSKSKAASEKEDKA